MDWMPYSHRIFAPGKQDPCRVQWRTLGYREEISGVQRMGSEVDERPWVASAWKTAEALTSAEL